jgi:LPS-assembly lipoprotein
MSSRDTRLNGPHGAGTASIQPRALAASAGRWGLVLAAAFVLGGCFRPLYGPTASGERVQDVLAAIEVEKVTSPQGQERIGHYVRSELIFELDGSGQPKPKRYTLSLDTAETIQPVSVDSISGRADQAMLNGTVKFSLKGAGGAVVLAGTARANASYQRDQQRFASVRAARDADIRVAKQLAEDIKQRLAAYFATAR